MKRTILAVLGAVTIAGAGLAAGSTALADTQSGNDQDVGNGYRYAHGTVDREQLSVQTTSQDQLRQRLHDGTGDNHENCDGTPGDQHQYHGSE